MRYIVDSLSPISHVEHPSFVALVNGLAPHVNVRSRRTLTRRIQDENKVMKSDVIELLRSKTSICLTADAWTGFKNRRSFMGVTGHVLNDDLHRKSFALACTLFTGSHTYDRIAKRLCKIMQDYSIPVENVVACVTDNGRNFVKAFREFNVDLATCDEEDEDEEPADVEQIQLFDIVDSPPADDASQRKETGDSDDEIEYDTDVTQLSQVQKIALPAHQRCASHTLNLVGCNAPTATARKSMANIVHCFIPAMVNCLLFGTKLTSSSQMK
jgi:hypothetical protein